MQITVNNPEQQTLIFGIIFFIALLAFIRIRRDKEIFPVAITNELKGLAILGVILSHIGYFLSTNTDFLFPFSVFAGVGVDMFLFLSGFGLTSSALKKELSAKDFYLKRLKKLIVPVWITIIILLIVDWLVLEIHYPAATIIKNLLGFFPRADLFNDINSPLWFISLILIYYLLFPLIFNKRAPWISAFIFYLIGYYFVQSPHQNLQDVLHLWRWHILSFPVGIAFASLLATKQLNLILEKMQDFFSQTKKLPFVLCLILSSLLLSIGGYLAMHFNFNIGWWYEEKMSVLIMLLIIIGYLILPLRFLALEYLGLYSFEIYLLHWPILYRYDLLYKFLPAGITTIIYLVLFVGLGFLLQKTSEKLLKLIPSLRS